MNKRTFYKNTALMTTCSLLLRLFGIAFRILISGRIGAEGMGLYQLVYSVYVLGTTFAVGGLITAVTRIAAQRLATGDIHGVDRLMRVCTRISLLVGSGSALVLYGGAPLIGNLIGDSRGVNAIALCGVALPFIGVSSSLKGYFLARRTAWPPCVSQIIEQAVRIGSILWMLTAIWDGSLEQACVIIIAGDAVSETAACVYLLIAYRVDRRRCGTGEKAEPHTPVSTLRPLLHIALPLTAGRYLTTALRTAENLLVPTRLSMYTRSDALALAQFGAVKGMALPLIFFPSALLMTVSGLLIPELSDAHALGQRRQVTRLVEISLHVTLLGAIFAGGLFTVLGREMGNLLYGDETVGLLLLILGPLTPVMYLDSVVTAMLKGLGQQVHSLWYTAADSLVRIVLIWLLLPRYGLTGFLFVMVVSNLLTCSLSTERLLTVSRTRLQWGRWVLRPALAASIAGMGCSLLPSEGMTHLLVGGGLYTAVYCLLIPLFRCFTKEDWQQFTARKTQKTAVG